MSDLLKTIFDRANLSMWSISGIGFTDVLDILVVAYLVYKVVTWIQETRAWSLFKGIMVLLLAMGMSRMFNLNTIYWFISNTLNVGLIALIVLFQPELRKALEQIGKGRMLGFFSADTEPEVSAKAVGEIVAAAEAMAKVKTGAIMVIGQDVALGDYEQTGIKLDALVSSQLLINIFENKTPLHDGAIIIKGNRIIAATCILPLTQEAISHDLGTRHRAAIGASEVSDATVLVVSEETGHMSIAKAGRLYRKLSGQQITEMLLGDKEPDKKKLVLWKGRQSDEEAH